MSAIILAFPVRDPSYNGMATANLLGLAEREKPLLRVVGDILDQSEPAFARKVAHMVALDGECTLRETERALTLCADAYALIADAVSTARDRLRDALADCTGPPPAA
jgi:hypothetical protein